MKKYLILGIALGIILALNAWAATTTISGKVTAINQDSTNPNIGSFSLIKNLNWLQKLTNTIFSKPIEQPVTLQVKEDTKFYLRTSQTTGFTEGSFSDLKVNDQVVVNAEATNNPFSYTALEVKITGRFIPTTKPIPPVSQCQTDADCTWCGMSCVLKTTLKDRMCAQVMPAAGMECKCVDERCKAVSATSTPSTTLVPSNREQILQEAARIKNQIKTLEQRLKELEKLLNTTSSTL